MRTLSHEELASAGLEAHHASIVDRGRELIKWLKDQGYVVEPTKVRRRRAVKLRRLVAYIVVRIWGGTTIEAYEVLGLSDPSPIRYMLKVAERDEKLIAAARHVAEVFGEYWRGGERKKHGTRSTQG